MSTPICKVWDAEKGKYVGIPAIKGATGADGKSAYQYAVEGGFTGTETEFAAKLAADIPSDGHINSLIDTKLGVIENGSY